MHIRTIDERTIHVAVRDMVIEASRKLPPDVYAAIETAMAQEVDDSAQEVLRQLLENADLARKVNLPLCQDTGAAVFFVERGEQVAIEDAGLNNILTAAMVEAYDVGFLRKSLCHPLTRKNTGNNTPAVIHTEVVLGDELRIQFMAKGGGSENMSRCTMLTPAQGWEGIKDFVVKRMAEAGPNPCPPTIVGVGIGGTFDLAPILAKKALFRSVGQAHADVEIAALEDELRSAINALGIGPMGLGGKTTCLDVKIEMHPCHIASLPVAVNVQCHSSRHRVVVL